MSQVNIMDNTLFIRFVFLTPLDFDGDESVCANNVVGFSDM